MFSSAQMLLYLNSTSLEFYLPSGQKVICQLPPDILDNLEIKNSDKFNEVLLDFLKTNNIPKSKAVLILADDVVFRKEISDKDPQKISEAVDSFLNEIPVEPNKINYQVVKNNENPYLVAANKDLYGQIVKVSKGYGLSILSVIPLTASWVGQVNGNTSNELLKNISKLKFADFLSHQISSEQLKVKATQKNSFNLPLFILVIVIIAGISSFIAYKVLTINKNNSTAEKLPSEERNTELPKPTAIPTLTMVVDPGIDLDKTKIKIQVLNGSGGTGVAAKAKTILVEKGYTDVETGNAESSDYKNITINIKDSMKKYADLLISDLKADYSVNPKVGVLNESSQFDTQIIIGN